MMTYLKHVGNKKHADLKTKSFDEIKALYEKVKRFDDSFITIGSTEDERKIKEINEGASDPDKKKKIVKEDISAKIPAKQDVAEQGTKKRKGGHMKMIARKRKRPQPDIDSDDEHRKCLKIITFEGTINSEIMETKSFISKLDKVSSPEGDYLVVYRVNGNFRAFNYLMKIVTWRLYEAYGVCILEFKDGTVIHMLVERKYPLSKELLQRMLDFGLEVEVESTAALDLIRRIAKDVKETLRSDQDLSECLNTSSMKFKESTPKKHEVKQVQQSCLGEDCWELYIPDLVPIDDVCVQLTKNNVLDLEKAKDAQAKEIAGLKKRRRLDDAEIFDTDDLHGDEVIVDMAVVTTADEGVTVAKIDEITPTSAPTTIINELTLAQTLIEIKAAKPKAVTTTATTTTTRPKVRGVVVQEPSEFRTTTSSPQASQPSKTKDKGKAIMIEPEVPLKKKDQVALDEEMARNLEAQLQAELIEEEKMARKKEEEANIALIESWENTQAMMEADRLLAERLQTREQEELTDEEKAKLFMEFIEKRRKHFAALRAQEKRNRPPTKTQKRNQMSIYLKHMGGYKHNQLKGRSYDEIQKLSKKTEIAQDSSAKRAGDKLESDEFKKQKTGENEQVEVDNEADLKMHMVIVKDDDIAIDAIPLTTKPPIIIESKLIKEGIIRHYQLIRADESYKRYSSR
ncbi:hypothetical protein Tco_0542010 [Tanacetum coccineum]